MYDDDKFVARTSDAVGTWAAPETELKKKPEHSLTQDIGILAQPGMLKARIKEDAELLADEAKRLLVQESQRSRTMEISIGFPVINPYSDWGRMTCTARHAPYFKKNISAWAKMQGYSAHIDFKKQKIHLTPRRPVRDAVLGFFKSRITRFAFKFAVAIALVVHFFWIMAHIAIVTGG